MNERMQTAIKQMTAVGRRGKETVAQAQTWMGQLGEREQSGESAYATDRVEQVAGHAVRQGQTAARGGATRATEAGRALFRRKRAVQREKKTAQRTTKVMVSSVKKVVAGAKSLATAIFAAGWVAVLVVVFLCLAAGVLASPMGIFLAGEGGDRGRTMPQVVQSINRDYQARLDEIRATVPHDVVEVSGSRGAWQDVLAVYAVKLTTDPEQGQEVVTLDSHKEQMLRELFWDMNTVSYGTQTVTETVVVETDDGAGNLIETETVQSRVHLIITVSHTSAWDMAEKLGFTQGQTEALQGLLSQEHRGLWAVPLYGMESGGSQLVAVALSQVGNVGGEPYWSWYGFSSRVEWCACFVSWCANQCGYLEDGVLPRFSGCIQGSNWFKARDRWQDRTYVPNPGDIIFFDWTDDHGPDGLCDHVGIVEKMENGMIYTVEGNSGDACRQNRYPVGSFEIYGYGLLNAT